MKGDKTIGYALVALLLGFNLGMLSRDLYDRVLYGRINDQVCDIYNGLIEMLHKEIERQSRKLQKESAANLDGDEKNPSDSAEN